MASSPLALPPMLPTELLTYILAHQAFPITLIICKQHAAFLDSSFKCVSSHPSVPPQSPQAAQAHNETLSEPSDDLGIATPYPGRHSLLIPTLYQVATSRYINVIFVPTVSHLRAYLAVFPDFSSSGASYSSTTITTSTITAAPGDPPQVRPPDPQFMKSSTQVPLLVVYGLVEMHKSTSEWSVQGLSRSLAGLVEAGWRAGRKVVVMEERLFDGEEEEGEEEEEEDLAGDTDADEARVKEKIKERKEKGLLRVWEERVPMLNGSIRKAGFESEGGGWSGRTVAVGRILERWFRFGRAV